MNRTTTLIVTSVLSVILFALHWVDEISRGMEQAKVANLPGVAILVVWLSGPLVFGPRRTGYIIMLIGGILGLGVLVLHMTGGGLVGGRIANTDGIYFWVLTALALGVTSTISGILAGLGLWESKGSDRRPAGSV
jgi:hypothetical protein